MKEDVKTRALAFIKYKGLTMKSFENQCGLSSGYITSMRKSFGSAKLNNVLNAFPELNRDWLLYGEGEMLNSSTKELIKQPEATWVPLINIDSVGGMNHGNIITSGEQYAERLIPFTEAREGDVAIYQSGDSMNPGIPSGSILLIRNVPDWREYFGYGDVFVLWLKDDRRLTKQIKKYSPDPANYVTCHSFNPDFGDEELPKKYIREVWKVIKVLADKGW